MKQLLNAVKQISSPKVLQKLTEEVRCVVQYSNATSSELQNTDLAASESDCIAAWNKQST